MSGYIAVIKTILVHQYFLHGSTKYASTTGNQTGPEPDIEKKAIIKPVKIRRLGTSLINLCK